jgi:hypothetical protein
LRRTSFLEALLDRQRVLFINVIRSDVPSGGNTSTQNLLKSLNSCSELKQIRISPSSKSRESIIHKWGFILTTMPAPFFVFFSRLSGSIWVEFFIRLSPAYFFYCLWLRYRYRPDLIIFNHHASFFYQLAFIGQKKILIWHDVPSLKNDESVDLHVGKRFCARLERFLINLSDYNLTFSFDDQKLLKRLHRRSSFLIPVISDAMNTRDVSVNKHGLLLIANWSRIENTEGATAFLRSYYDGYELKAVSEICLHFAGHGSTSYVQDLIRSFPEFKILNINTTEWYSNISQFNEFVVLAPLLRGAGIKLKTIEAWSCGIPVIGTRQAFTGIPKSIWQWGGVLVDTPEAMSKLCHNIEELGIKCEKLDPGYAFRLYQNAINHKPLI